MKKDIPGFPGYSVTSGGDVFGPEGQLSPRPDNDGYLRVDLRKNGQRVTRFVHSLVALAFHGSATEVDHKDGDRTNDTAKNLEPVSHDENMKRMAARHANKKPSKKR
jgi:hypothetical protein